MEFKFRWRRHSASGTPVLDELFRQLNRTQRKELRREIGELSTVKQKARPWLSFAWQTILFVLGFVGGTSFVQVWNSYPNVNPTQMDRKLAFRFPFVVSNDQSLVTYYVVTPSFAISRPDIEKGTGGAIWGSRITGTLGNPATLHPGDKAPFNLPDTAFFNLPPHLPEHLSVDISVAYEIRLIPFFPWHRHHKFGLRMLK